MNQFLRGLSPTQQVAILFLIVFGLLFIVSVAMLLLTLRERRNPVHDKVDEVHHENRQREFQHSRALLRTTWVMAIIFWIAWALGDTVATVLFAFISFYALREFTTLSPTRRGDHRSLILAFFVVLPIQFWLVASEHFNLFTVFIPVYVFLALPVISALADDPRQFLERNAKLQWGIMVCVYGLSHVPALLLLSFPGYAGKNAFLVFFLVAVVQTCMLVQHLASRRQQLLSSENDKPGGWLGSLLHRLFMQQPFAPHVSRGFNWISWGLGMLIASFFGVLLSFITPFKYGQALAMSLIACAAGSMGHLVMKALKHDRGIPNWGQRGAGVTGANGLLDRVDALCFAAPVFFHAVRWYFDA
jgi:phosphatidate cytidylyltransferase